MFLLHLIPSLFRILWALMNILLYAYNNLGVLERLLWKENLMKNPDWNYKSNTALCIYICVEGRVEMIDPNSTMYTSMSSKKGSKQFSDDETQKLTRKLAI